MTDFSHAPVILADIFNDGFEEENKDKQSLF